MDNSIKNFLYEQEGKVLHSYQDTAGVWTIGGGSTMYQSGKKVGPGETITEEQSDQLMSWEVTGKSAIIKSQLGKSVLNDRQMVALISFTYNEGIGSLATSTLIQVLRNDPNDQTRIPVDQVKDNSVRIWMLQNKWMDVNIITMCFMMFNKIRNPKTGLKEFSEALIQRRLREAKMYWS